MAATGLKKKRQLAYKLFADGWTQTDIAEMCSITEKTISNWKKEDKWDEKLLADNTSNDNVVKRLRENLNSELDKKEACNADKVSKFAKALSYFSNKKILAHNTIQVLKAFMEYSQKNGHHKLAQEVASIAPTFVDFVLENEQ